MTTQELASHGTLVAYQATPGGAFGTIGFLNGDIQPPGLERPATEVTPHNAGIDYHVLGRLMRSEVTLGISYIPSNATHDHLTGLQKLIIDNTETGFRVTYPDASVVIFSGFVRLVQQAAPVREGALTAAVTLRPSGPHKIVDLEIS